MARWKLEARSPSDNNSNNNRRKIGQNNGQQRDKVLGL